MADENNIPPTLEEIVERLDRLDRLLFDVNKIEEIDQTDATRTSVIKTHRSGETVEMEWDSIHSVEITNTTKEGPRVSKVKVYDSDPMAAARVAASLFAEASSQLANILAVSNIAHEESSEESDG